MQRKTVKNAREIDRRVPVIRLECEAALTSAFIRAPYIDTFMIAQFALFAFVHVVTHVADVAETLPALAFERADRVHAVRLVAARLQSVH